MFCPTEEEALSRIQRDPAGARIFLISADKMDVAFDKLGLGFADRSAHADTPFFVLGAAVKEYLEDIRDNFPEQWVA